MRACVCARVLACPYVCIYERETERVRLCVRIFVRNCVCACVYVCVCIEREKEKERAFTHGQITVAIVGSGLSLHV